MIRALAFFMMLATSSRAAFVSAPVTAPTPLAVTFTAQFPTAGPTASPIVWPTPPPYLTQIPVTAWPTQIPIPTQIPVTAWPTQIPLATAQPTVTPAPTATPIGELTVFVINITPQYTQGYATPGPTATPLPTQIFPYPTVQNVYVTNMPTQIPLATPMPTYTVVPTATPLANPLPVTVPAGVTVNNLGSVSITSSGYIPPQLAIYNLAPVTSWLAVNESCTAQPCQIKVDIPGTSAATWVYVQSTASTTPTVYGGEMWPGNSYLLRDYPSEYFWYKTNAATTVSGTATLRGQ